MNDITRRTFLALTAAGMAAWTVGGIISVIRANAARCQRYNTSLTASSHRRIN